MRTLKAVLIAAALFLAPVLALAAYPTTIPSGTDFTVSANLSAACTSNPPAGCPANSVIGSNALNTATAYITISGTFTGTLLFECSGDNNLYAAWSATPVAGGTTVTSTTNTGFFRTEIAACRSFQVRMNPYTSGTATVTIHFSGAGSSVVTQSSGTNLHVNVDSAPSTVVTQSSGANLHVQCDSGCNNAPAWTYTAVTASGNTIIKGAAGTLAGIINLSTASQPAGLCQIFDNASTNTGPVLYSENGMAAGQVITFTSAGLGAVNGIVINCAVGPTTGLLLLWK